MKIQITIQKQENNLDSTSNISVEVEINKKLILLKEAELLKGLTPQNAHADLI